MPTKSSKECQTFMCCQKVFGDLSFCNTHLCIKDGCREPHLDCNFACAKHICSSEGCVMPVVGYTNQCRIHNSELSSSYSKSVEMQC